VFPVARSAACGLIACSALSGCTLLSPVPLLELAKASGTAVSSAIANGGPSSATNTVIHDHAPIRYVCIEYNPASQVPDIVPAIQIELKKAGIESRVYDLNAPRYTCSTWLKYLAYQEWGTTPVSGDFATFVSSITISLFTDGGHLIATSSYEKPGAFGVGKWSSTRSKVAPVITALTVPAPLSASADPKESP
jgi:hypothetical protein